MKLNKISKIGIAIMIVFMMMFVVQSFQKDRKTNTNMTSYFYTSSDTTPGAYGNPNNWDDSGGGGCTDGNAPCEIAVPDDTTLADHISGLSNSQVLAISKSRKSL